MKFGRLYRRRTSIERLFGNLKQYGALDTITVRRLDRVTLHVDLQLTAQLVLALARSENVGR